MTPRACPDCGRGMKPQQQSCACGYVVRAAGKAVVKLRCGFTTGDRNCPYVATSSGLCAYHEAHRGDYEMGLRILDDFDRNGPPKRQDWKDELIQQRIDQLGLRKRSGETSQAYIARCRAAIDPKWMEKFLARGRAA